MYETTSFAERRSNLYWSISLQATTQDAGGEAEAQGMGCKSVYRCTCPLYEFYEGSFRSFLISG